MLVGRPQGIGVAEVDLVLAEVALALGVLDRQSRPLHRVADPPDQRLDPRRAEHRVVDVVEVRRIELAVRLVPCLLVGVTEHQELELSAGVRGPPALGEAGQLRAQNLSWRGNDG